MPNNPAASLAAIRFERSRKRVLLGAARLVTAKLLPPCSTTKSRFVSPGTERTATGAVKINGARAGAVLYPKFCGTCGIWSVVLGTRSRTGTASADSASPIKQFSRSGVGFIVFSFLFVRWRAPEFLIGPLAQAAEIHGFKRHVMR